MNWSAREAAAVLGHDSPESVDPWTGPSRSWASTRWPRWSCGTGWARRRAPAAGHAGLRPPVGPTPSPTTCSSRSRRTPTPRANGHDEAAIRRALQTVPLAKLRAAGLLDSLLELAGVPPRYERNRSGPDEMEDVDAIDELDAESLIRMALHDGQPDDETEEG